MDFFNAFLTALSMSIDATTVNITNGISEKNMPIWKMILISFSYGLFQFLMPLIAYSIGQSFKNYIIDYIPWIAFALLTLLAIKSFIEWIIEFKKRKENKEIEPKKIKLVDVLVQDIATSIDALCIGFVYLNLSWGYALLTFGIVGIISFIIPLIAIILSQFFAKYLEKWAGLFSAIVFLGVGLKILLEGIL